MPRPRKDGKPAARATRIGVERTTGAGKKWLVRSYAPTDGAPYGRAWPKYIPYKNLRHHAALWWRDQGFAWATIAEWDGNTVKTLMSYYVIAPKRRRSKLERNLT